MQTCLVHMAHPIRLKREAGWRGLLTVNLLLGGGIVAALAFPLLPIVIAWALTDLAFGSGELLSAMLRPLHVASLLAGLIASIAIPLAGLARRKRLREAGVLLWMPFYWGYLSLAAWRALWLLIFDPTYWDKTEHGLSRLPTQPGRRSGHYPNRDRPHFEKLIQKGVSGSGRS